MNTGKALWLIDGGYLYKGQNAVEPGFQLNYKRLRDWLEKETPLWRAYYLNSMPNISSEQQDRFYTWLRTAKPDGPQIITRLYELKRTRVDRAFCEQCNSIVELKCPNHQSDGYHNMYKEQQKGVDVGLTTLALTLVDQYDTLILSAGDGDLVDAVEFLSRKGKRLELLTYRIGVSTDLQCRADKIHWIDDFKNEVRG